MEVMIETCCGIDVHQKSIVCCILDGPLESNKPKKIQKKFGDAFYPRTLTLSRLDLVDRLNLKFIRI